MASHLTDVASSDQHTVKPWFTGKLDFAPRVVDLAGQGSPLVGGRLDYLEGHPAAAMVYQRRKHLINLFIWPAADGGTDTIPKATSRHGFNVVSWRVMGIEYWAVSDLNARELLDFVRAFQAAG
jgi:anti-sigma factor RsiW